jgi:ADP-heptose:LPS heptosyltransferase
MLLLTPSVVALKHHRPRILLDILGHEESIRILEPFSQIDQLWTISGDEPDQRLDADITRIRYDQVIEMHGRPFSKEFVQKNTFGGAKRYFSDSIVARDEWKNSHASERDWLVISELLGLPRAPLQRPKYPDSNIDLKELGLPDLDRFAIFQTQSSDPSRTWFVESWRELALDLISNFDLERIILPFGPRSEELRVRRISRGIPQCSVPRRALSFDEHAALLRRSTVCISVNTGTMHLAAAVDAKIVAIWGPETAPMNVWHPLCETFLIVREDEIIRPRDVRDARRQGGIVDNNKVSTVSSAVGELLNSA